MECANIGKLCPLCKKGIITYERVFATDVWDRTETEKIGCSNSVCLSNKDK